MNNFKNPALLETLSFENMAAEKKGWSIYDSGLVSGEHPLEFDFAKLYPKGFNNIRTFLEKTYKRKKGKLVGLEIGGSGSRLFADFSPGFLERSLGVTLTDLRNHEFKVMDKQRNHSVLAADAFKLETDNEIRTRLDGKPIDLLFERMENGLLGFPEDVSFFKDLIARWYSLLNEGGVMFVQSPYVLEPNNISAYKGWLNQIRTKFGIDVLDYSFDANRFYIKIKKQQPFCF